MLPWASDSNQRVHSPCSQCHRLLKPGLCSRHLARPASYYFNLLNPLEGSLWCARDLHARNNFMTSYQELKVSNPCLHPLLLPRLLSPPLLLLPIFLTFLLPAASLSRLPSSPLGRPPHTSDCVFTRRLLPGEDGIPLAFGDQRQRWEGEGAQSHRQTGRQAD